MAYNDNFVRHSHPRWAQRLLIRFNGQVLRFILRVLKKKEASVLEIGPGKGYFYAAVKRVHGDLIEYFCCAQNAVALEQFPSENTFQASVPPLPKTGRSFDVIYAAYVIEHLSSGKQVYDLVRSCRENLNPGGILYYLPPTAEARSLSSGIWTTLIPTRRLCGM